MKLLSQPTPPPVALRLLLLVLGLLPLQALAALSLEGAPPDGQPLALGPHYEYIEDAGNSLTLEQLLSPQQTLQWRKLADEGENPNFGYTASSYWLRVRLPAPSQPQQRWLLELPFPTLDRAELFVVRRDTRELLQHDQAGDRQAFADRPYPHRNPVFPLRLSGGKGVDIYLHVASQGSLTVGAYLWPEEAFHRHSRITYNGISLYFGILLALFLYNLLLYYSLHDRAYLFYIALVGSMAIGQAGWSGIGFEYLWPDYPAWANVAALTGFNAAGFFGALFTRDFLALPQRSPWLDRASILCGTLFGLLLLSIPVAPYQFLAIATSMTGLLFSLAVALIAVICLRKGNRSARYFLLAWAILLVGIGVLAARNLGWLPTNLFTSNAMLIGSAAEMVLLSFALAERINVFRRAKEDAEIAAVAAHRSMMEVLEQTELELESKVRERTSDLEALTQRLQSREKQLESLAHKDPLTGLYNRLGFDNHLNEALLQAAMKQRNLGIMMLDLDGFKPINDTYGHDIGDALLKVVGRRLLQSVRSTDTVARIGGDEFIILLENIHTVAELRKIADNILDGFRETVALDHIKLRIGVSIGIAMYPADGKEQRDLIKSADMAMYQAKSAGRGRYSMAPGMTGLS